MTFRPVIALFLGLAPLVSGEIIGVPDSANKVIFLKEGNPYLDLGFVGWGPRWKWLGFTGSIREKNRQTRLVNTATIRKSGARVTLGATLRQDAPNTLRADIDLTGTRDTDLTCIAATLGFAAGAFASHPIRVTDADGKQRTVQLPLGRKGLGTSVRRIVLTDRDGAKLQIDLKPPANISTDGEARILLAEKTLKKDQTRRISLRLTFADAFTWFPTKQQLPDDVDPQTWFPFTATGNTKTADDISMASWLEAPAGKSGRIVRRGETLTLGGRPIKLWGLNLCYSACSPERSLAEKQAAFYAKYGINAVRLHKYADGTGWAGIQAPDSFVRFDPKALDRMDYLVAKLKEKGIYVSLSSTFGVKLGPADREAVPYMDEFGHGKKRISTGSGSIFLSRELQDLQIRQVVELLRHRNPYTGLTYAKDPVVATVELFNEDSALFFGTLRILQTIPTLRQRAEKRFSAWLKERYRTQKGLEKAWGKNCLNVFRNEGFTDESWDRQTIAPVGNPWFYDPDQLAGSQKDKKARLLDTMLFLYQIQNEFYSRYAQALRQAGYEGEILASNWQAGRAFSHYYNLHSDATIGLIDRHNYFGGGRGAKIHAASMLSQPGSGILGAGMQQVKDRPFMLSEWIHVYPNEWGVEGPAIIGAYGMGLQGWDASFMFQNRDQGCFSPQLGQTPWDVTTPQILGIFPAVSRMILRGDVTESKTLAVRAVHIPSFQQGILGFDERIRQEHDVKTFDGNRVPALALALVRTVVDFTDTFQKTPIFDPAPYLKGDALQSSTRQLRWWPGKTAIDGHIAINTAGTKAVVGFARGKTFHLGSVTIQPLCRFAAIFLTARERDANLAGAHAILITAIARARNSGMKIYRDNLLAEKGHAPILMEPVKARIQLRDRGPHTVWILDHDGVRTDRRIPVQNGAFTIDGTRDKTCYYLLLSP